MQAMQLNFLCRYAAFMILGCGAANPAGASEFGDAVLGGGAWLDMRFRTELVDQENLPRNAAAHTLRSRAGYATGIYRGLSAMAEYEYIFHLGAERFNNGNERFVGDVGFRQNMQTFDAVSVINRTIPKTELRYEYIARANRIFGRESSFGDWEMDGHAMSAAWQGTRAGKLTGYGYLFDIDDQPDLSSQTYGVRWDARGVDLRGLTFKYAAEAAWQSDYSHHRGDYDAGYYLLQPSLSNGQLTLTAGYEVLGSGSGRGFTIPLAALHKFQGFTDVFTATPPKGVRDLMMDINYQRTDIAPFDVLRLWGGAHHFSASDGGGYLWPRILSGGRRNAARGVYGNKSRHL